jgi:Rieske Fe-S protein
MSETTRRTVLAGAAGISAAVALAACGDDEADSGGNTGADPGTTSTAGAAGGLASVADIPVNGGKIFAAENVVITQPTAGEIKAYSATCTHQACKVAAVENGIIRCPCHNSQFKIADGSVAAGPAPKPLPSVAVKVENGKITLG